MCVFDIIETIYFDIIRDNIKVVLDWEFLELVFQMFILKLGCRNKVYQSGLTRIKQC